MVDISGLNKAVVLKALYDRSHILGKGILQAVDHFTLKDAEEALIQTSYFDYLYGRVMKVDLSKDEFDEWGYDRDNGSGAAQKVIDQVRKNNEQMIEEPDL